jgi:hypothetical protein
MAYHPAEGGASDTCFGAQAAAQQLGPAEAGRRACQSILDNNDMYFSVPYCVLGLFVLLIIFHVGSYLALARLRIKTRA